MPPPTAADEARIVAARTRLADAGYPADDLSDEEVWAGRRVWWGREAEWAGVAREFPRVAGAIVAWIVRHEKKLPRNLTIRARPVRYGIEVVMIRSRSGRDRKMGYAMEKRWEDEPDGALVMIVWDRLDLLLKEVTRFDEPRYREIGGSVRPYRPSDFIPPGSL